MKRDALALVRILPVGAADIGEDVTREDLRQAGAGDWFVGDRVRDDVSCVFERAGEISAEEYDVPIPMTEEAPQEGLRVVQMRFRDAG